jgi:hypothetical protein
MVSLSSSQITQDVIATGSSDGLIRVVQIHPSKFLGVIAAHGTSFAEQEPEDGVGDKKKSNTEGFPIERMKLDRHKKWLGSISHDDLLKLTDIEGALEGSENDSDEQINDRDSVDDHQDVNDQNEDEHDTGGETHRDDGEDKTTHEVQTDEEEEEVPHVVASVPVQAIGRDSDSDASLPSSYRKQSKKRKKKELKREEKKKRNKGRPATSFFADL